MTTPRPAAPALAVRALDAPFDADGPSQGAGVRDVTFDVADGERVVLLGPSGAGKSTLLRAVAGLTPVRGGSVHVTGRDVTDAAPERRDVVYLHQVPVLFPHLDVLGNVAFPLRMRGASTRNAREAAARWLAPLGLDALASRRPDALSGGQRHRVALARALAAVPRVLLLDEPLAALDPGTRADVRAAITDAHAAAGTALVLVTHDLDDATVLADRLLVMLDGAVVQDAGVGTVLRRPAHVRVARLLGLHDELPARRRDDGRIVTPLGVLAATSETPTHGTLQALVRHDAIRLSLLDDDDAHAVVRVEAVRPARLGAQLRLTLVRPAAAWQCHEAAAHDGTDREIAGPSTIALTALSDGYAVPPVGAELGVRLEARGVHVVAGDG